MTETPTSTKTLDIDQLLEHLRPARMELGIRRVSMSRTDEMTYPECSEVYFQIGMERSTSTVRVTLNSLDLYDVEIFKYRGLNRSDLGELRNVFAEDLARAIIGEWCAVCSRKGW